MTKRTLRTTINLTKVKVKLLREYLKREKIYNDVIHVRLKEIEYDLNNVRKR